MVSTTQPGIRVDPLFNSYTPSRGPMPLELPFETAETQNRAKSGRLLVHRLSYALGPDRIRKATLKLTWQQLSGADVDFLNDALAWGGPIPVAPWLPVTESFPFAAAGAVNGLLSRQDAYTVLGAPTGTGTDMQAAYGLDFGERLGAVTIGAYDLLKRTPWSGVTLSTAPARVFVAYYPIYWMVIATDQMTYPQVMQQSLTVTMVET